MTLRSLILIPSLSLLLSSCGGSSSSIFNFDGTWRSALSQLGGVSCSDGSFFGVGSGVPTREVDFSVENTSPIGAQGTLTLGDCSYQGLRSEEASITFSSETAGCSREVTLSLTGEQELEILLSPMTPMTAEDGTVICVISEAGIAVNS